MASGAAEDTVSPEQSFAEEVAGWGPPLPMRDRGAYTPDRVKKGLEYAETLLAWGLETSPIGTMRKIPPFTARFLQLYQVACRETLRKLKKQQSGARTPTDLKGLIYEIYEHEECLQGHQFLKMIASPYWWRTLLLGPVIKLLRFELYIRYGDYLLLLINELCSKAHELGIVNEKVKIPKRKWKAFIQSLTDGLKDIGPIATSLATEQIPESTQTLVEEDFKAAPSLRAIYNTAEALCTDWSRLVCAIQNYVSRDQLVYSQLDEHLYLQNFGSLKKTLYKDHLELGILFAQEDAGDMELFEIIILRLIHRWFNVSDEERASDRKCRAKPELLHFSHRRKWNAHIVDPEEKRRAEEVRKQREANSNRKLMQRAVRDDVSEDLIKYLFQPQGT